MHFVYMLWTWIIFLKVVHPVVFQVHNYVITVHTTNYVSV